MGEIVMVGKTMTVARAALDVKLRGTHCNAAGSLGVALQLLQRLCGAGVARVKPKRHEDELTGEGLRARWVVSAWPGGRKDDDQLNKHSSQ